MEINYYVWMYFILIRNFGLFFFIIGILMNNVKNDCFCLKMGKFVILFKVCLYDFKKCDLDYILLD